MVADPEGAGGANAAAGEGEHPGPPVVRLARGIAREIVDQARAEYPNEACGIIPGTADPAAGGAALRYEPCRNEAASPYRYRVHPDDVFRVLVDIDDADGTVWAVVHSHVKSPAVPSLTDIGLAQFPEALYLLVSLAEDEADPITGEPSLRAWRIVGERTFEVGLVLE